MRFIPLLLSAWLIGSTTLFGQSRTVLLDADTANEVDDPFALARVLLDENVRVIALNATQWEPSHYAVPNTMLASHRLNESMLGYLNLDYRVPTFMGGQNRMYDWGDKAQHSAAAYQIIEAAKAQPDGQQLDVIALGALTNVASALTIAPDIAPKLKLYWLGSKYDFEREVMSKTDFNCVMDVQALEVVLDAPVALYIMPVSVARKLNFTFEEVFAELPADHRFTGFLRRLWDDHRDGGRQSRTLWDIGIVGAYLRPELVDAVVVPAPKVNGSREITYYRDMDVPAMKQDFFRVLRQRLR